VRVLGEGAFGAAYLAEQLGTDRLAVVKIAHGEGGRVAPHMRQRFAAEVRAATRIRHPGLCTVYTFGETTDRLPAIAMEYIDGETLRSRLVRLQRRPMPLRELVDCFVQLATVLELVHGHQIVHRDVTPNNVMLTMDHDGKLVVKLVDFGIARLSERSSGEYVAGTPGYAAPEQFSGTATSASDVFSFGALLWWAATGRELLEDIHEPEKLFHAVQNLEQSPDPKDVLPDILPALDRLVRSLLEPVASFRPSLEEVREELELLLVPGASSVKRSVLVIGDGGQLVGLLKSAFTPFGVRVVSTPDPRLASRQDGTFGAFLIAAHLTSPSAATIFHHLAQICPETPAFVVAMGAGNVTWDDIPFEARIRLPGGAYRLNDLGEQLRDRRTMVPPSMVATSAVESMATMEAYGAPPPRRSEQWNRWIGEMPNLLLELESVVTEGGDVGDACLAIEALARTAEVREVETLCHMLRVLHTSNDITSPLVFIADIEAAFVRATRDRSPSSGSGVHTPKPLSS
jgi:serine/threonine protein kinase